MNIRKTFIGTLIFLFLLSINIFAYDYVSIPNTFVPYQIIKSSQINANYTALANAISDGSKKINIAELYLNSVRIIQNDGSVNGADATFSGTLGVTGNVTFDGVTTINNNLAVTGSATVTGVTTLNGATTVNNDLTVTGNAAITGITTLTGAATINNDLTVTGNSTLTGELTVNNDITVTGNSNLQTLSVTGNSTLTGTLTVNNDLTATGNLAITGTSVFTDSVTVNNELFVQNDITTSKNIIMGDNGGSEIQFTGALPLGGFAGLKWLSSGYLQLINNGSGAGDVYLVADTNIEMRTGASSLVALKANISQEVYARYAYSDDVASKTPRAAYLGDDGQLGYSSSSRRYKTLIKPLKGKSEYIYKLKPVEFERKGNRGIKEHGLIAEDVYPIKQEIVYKDTHGKIDGVAYDKLIPDLLNEIQKLNKRIIKLEKQIKRN